MGRQSRKSFKNISHAVPNIIEKRHCISGREKRVVCTVLGVRWNKKLQMAVFMKLKLPNDAQES